MTEENTPRVDPKGFIDYGQGPIPGAPIDLPMEDQMMLTLMGLSRVALLDMSEMKNKSDQDREEYAAPMNMRTEVWMVLGQKRAPIAIVSEVDGRHASTEMFLREEFEAIKHVVEEHDKFVDEQSANNQSS